MKSDLDSLMQARNLDAMLVLGNAEHNPPMYYLTGGGHITGATLIKKCGEAPVLFHQDMERGEAEKTNLKIRSYSEYPWQELLKEANGDPALMAALRLQRIFKDHSISGRVGLYGHTDVSSTYAMLTHLRVILPDVEIVGEARDGSLFMYAMETKDETEVSRIRCIGRTTTEVVGLTAEYLTSCLVREDEVLLQEDGSPLTIADVKEKINLWLAERGASPTEGYIFSIGRDAGLPHSQGDPADLLRLGQTIVFDIYPQENGGGYFYDFTRTWCLGYAPREAQDLYDQVMIVFNKVLENLDLNAPFKDLNRMVCEEFEKMGHQSPLNTAAPVEGYVHSLGHGLGLNVHERPWSGLTATDDNLLKPGVVVTSEPGLYYPEKGMGVRIEDSIWIRPDGKAEILAEYPYDLVLKMKNWKKK
jgi:Xaa-Pro aminopeptidase